LEHLYLIFRQLTNYLQLSATGSKCQVPAFEICKILRCQNDHGQLDPADQALAFNILAADGPLNALGQWFGYRHGNLSASAPDPGINQPASPLGFAAVAFIS
jgi:hypothetical protein